MLYRAHLLNPCSPTRLEEIPDALMEVNAAGCITAVGAFEELAPRLGNQPMEDLRPLWILPGMVDLHVHLPQHEAVAMDGLELLPWLETFIFPAEARFADTSVARASAARFFQGLLYRGTTTASIYATVHAEATDAAFHEADRCGIRAILGKVMMDQHSPAALQESTAESLAQSEALCQTWHGRSQGRLQYAFTPRFAPTCSSELMRGAGLMAEKYGAYIQTHLSENLAELAWVKALFPEAANYTDVYQRMHMLGPRTLLAHGIHLDAGERQVIRESGATIVHCPRSNAFLQSGIMPLRRYLGEGLSVGLGTDVGAGPSLSMWAEAAAVCTTSKLRWAERQNLAHHLRAMGGLEASQRAEIMAQLDLNPLTPVDPVQAFHLATLGGARALGLDSRIGSLEVGKDADFVVVDPRMVDPAVDRPAEPPERVLSRMLYREHPGMVRATYVRGARCFAAT
ncbi:MAG: guanine deaminase [Holophaga sp.]|nr:guanine deaminase [Holophaga sp.]